MRMNKVIFSVGETNKKVWCKPVIKVVELDPTDIIATSDGTIKPSLQSMEEEDWYIEN